MEPSWDELFERPVGDTPGPPSAALDTLQAAAATRAPVSLMAAHMSLSCAGRLRSATRDGVVVELPNPPETLALTDAVAAITFPLAGKTAGFTGRVTEVEALEDGGFSVTVEVPDKIRTDEQRATVRIPIPDGTLEAALMRDEDLEAVKAIDISLTGLLIEFPQDQVPDISEGHRRMISLELDGKTVILEAEVRRRDGPRYGLAFVLRDERPPELTRFLVKLQHLWLAS